MLAPTEPDGGGTRVGFVVDNGAQQTANNHENIALPLIKGPILPLIFRSSPIGALLLGEILPDALIMQGRTFS